MGKVKISACYIARNEEKNIKKSLQSIVNTVDEIIFVDTGSVDATPIIAQKYGARVYNYAWQDDFSAPRNFALSKVAGDWIVFIDADEYFSEEFGFTLRQIITEQWQRGFNGGLLIRRYDIDTDKAGDILADTLVLRVFANKPRRHYHGLVHEELWDADEPVKELLIVPPTQIKLWHTGYSRSLSETKARRNLALLEKELAAGTNPGRLYMYLADVYLGLGDEDKAWHYASLDVRQGRRGTTYASRSYRILLELSLKGKTDMHGRLSLCQAAVRDYPENPEFRADLGECLASLGWYQEAAEMMSAALTAYENYTGIEPMLMTDKVAQIVAKRQDLFTNMAREKQELMGMLIKALCAMSDECYLAVAAKDVLPPGYLRVLGAYHGEMVNIEHDSGVYMDILSCLLAQKGEKYMEKMLVLLGQFPSSVRQDVVAMLDKKIQQEEGAQ